MRDADENVIVITEVKSGNANIKPKQFDALQGICAQLGASLTYKIQRGDGAGPATKFLREKDCRIKTSSLSEQLRGVTSVRKYYVLFLALKMPRQ